MERTFPFWAGGLILLVPAATMILAVLNALPGWVPLVVTIVLFTLPVPAGLSLIASGVRSFREDRALAAGFDLIGGVVTLLAALGFLVVFVIQLLGRMTH
jgi:hypothetical protein